MSAQLKDSKSKKEFQEEEREIVSVVMTLEQAHFFYNDITMKDFLEDEKIKHPDLFFKIGKYVCLEFAEMAYVEFLRKFEKYSEERLKELATPWNWEDKFKPDLELEKLDVYETLDKPLPKQKLALHTDKYHVVFYSSKIFQFQDRFQQENAYNSLVKILPHDTLQEYRARECTCYCPEEVATEHWNYVMKVTMTDELSIEGFREAFYIGQDSNDPPETTITGLPRS